MKPGCRTAAPADDHTPHALDSERLLLGALVSGHYVREILNALAPEMLWRRDHALILREAIALDARGVVPDARLINGTIGEQLDQRAAIYAIADDRVGLTPSGVAEHARRIRETWAAREALRILGAARSHVRREPKAAVNGLAVSVAEELEAIRQTVVRDEACASRPLAELAGSVDAPLRVDLVGPLLAEREIAMLHGQPRARKSWIAHELALALTAGVAPFGCEALRPRSTRPALLLGNEDAERVTAHRLFLLMRGHGLTRAPDGLRLLLGQGASLDEPGWRARIVDEVRRHHIALLIVDPVRSVSAATDQGPSELQPLARYLRQIVAETGVTILLVHHDAKPLPGVTDTRRRAQRASGGGLFAIVDAPLHVEAADEQHSLLAADGFKHAADPPSLLIELQVDEHEARLVARTTTGKSAESVALDTAVVAHIRQNDGGSGRAIAAALHRRRDDVLDALERLRQAGTVDSRPDKNRSQNWFLR